MKDDDSFEEFKTAFRRGDILKMAYLTNREWHLAAQAWKTNPLRYALGAFAIALALRLFRELMNGPLLLDLCGTIIFVVGAGMTIWLLFRSWFSRK